MLDEFQNQLPTGFLRARVLDRHVLRPGCPESSGPAAGGRRARPGRTAPAVTASRRVSSGPPTSPGAATRPAACSASEPVPSETTTLSWSPGALVFVTSAIGTGQLGSWPQADGATGIDAGYKICQSLAAVAGLPSPASFVPWLSTNLVDARDRLTTDGPFRRILRLHRRLEPARPHRRDQLRQPQRARRRKLSHRQRGSRLDLAVPSAAASLISTRHVRQLDGGGRLRLRAVGRSGLCASERLDRDGPLCLLAPTAPLLRRQRGLASSGGRLRVGDDRALVRTSPAGDRDPVGRVRAFCYAF